MQKRVADLLAGLDDRQRAAATVGPGPVQVIAPAGSGKTATLVARIGVLIEAGVPAPRILVVTFNRDAAAELTERIRSRLGISPGGEGPEVRTLHALARQIVLDAGRPVRLVVDRLPLLRRARRQVLAASPPETFIPSAEELDAVVSAVTLEGRACAPPASDVIAAYRRLLAADQGTDFDLLLVDALELIRRDSELGSRWQRRFAHVLVDEFQDVDASQFDLVALLSEPERNLFVVGDDDQTIYAWRLADVRRILEFPTRYPDARRIVLETNYRCPPTVVAAADRLISGNRERVPKRLRSAAGQVPVAEAGFGLAPMATWAIRGPDGDRHLAEALRRWAAETGRVAVLARTRSELGPLILALLSAGIRHATSIPSVIEAASVEALVDDLRSDDPAAAPLPALVRARVARGWQRGHPAGRLGAEDLAAVDAAVGWAVGTDSIGDYLDAFTRARARLAVLRDPDAPIELTTVHGAKGREWPMVVVLGLETDRFPNRRAIVEADDPARAMEEERRLAYVAVTRCRRHLVLAFDPARPSPFVAELLGTGSPEEATAYRPTSSAMVSR